MSVGVVRRLLTTREGGYSRAPYDSLNLGEHVGDAPDVVAANRGVLAQRIGLPMARLVWMEQVHRARVAVVDGPQQAPLMATDGVVTATPGLALVVLAADCVPMLLADEGAAVVGAVHAGRVGARSGILAAALSAMVAAGAHTEAITVLLGPAVCGRCYEVPADMQAAVVADLPGSASRTRAGTPGLDIRAGLRRQLREAGVSEVDQDPRCTVETPELFSHRRGAPTGRFAGAIWVQPR